MLSRIFSSRVYYIAPVCLVTAVSSSVGWVLICLWYKTATRTGYIHVILSLYWTGHSSEQIETERNCDYLSKRKTKQKPNCKACNCMNICKPSVFKTTGKKGKKKQGLKLKLLRQEKNVGKIENLTQNRYIFASSPLLLHMIKKNHLKVAIKFTMRATNNCSSFQPIPKNCTLSLRTVILIAMLYPF